MIVSAHRLRRGRPAASSPSGAIVGTVAFIWVFPGFVFYQTMVDAGLFPPFLGGFFTAACAMALLPLLLGVRRHLNSLYRVCGFTMPLYALYLTLFGLRIYLGNLEGAHHWIVGSHAAYLLKWIAIFLIGCLAAPVDLGLRKWYRIAFAAVAVVVLYRAVGPGLLTAELARQGNESFNLDYQGIGHAMLALAIFCAPTLGRPGRFAVYIASILALFIVGARSELVAMFIAVTVIEYAKARNRSLLLLSTGLTMWIGMLALPSVELPEHRVFNLLRLEEDRSAIERLRMNEQALQTIAEHPFTGDYASYEPGHYAHNILSVWVDLGFAGLVLLAVLVGYPTWQLVARFRSERTNDLYVLSLTNFAVVVLLLVFAKHFNYQMIPLALGVYCQYRIARAGGWYAQWRGSPPRHTLA